jgi:hypothetical protein
LDVHLPYAIRSLGARSLDPRRGPSKRISSDWRKLEIRKTHELRSRAVSLQSAGIFASGHGTVRNFVAF